MKRCSFAAYMLVFLIVFQTNGAAQQRPLVNEDPRLIPAGFLDVETGVAYDNDSVFTISGLHGDHVALLQSGLHFGLGDRAEFQLAGTVRDYLRTPDGVWHQDFGDLSLSTKIKIFNETRRSPMIAFRPTFVLPNANQSSGLGLNTNRFFASVLLGKTVRRAFVFGNVGIGIIDDPTRIAQQNDVLTGGVAVILPLTTRFRVLAEFNGVRNPRDRPTPGSESRGQVRSGLQVEAKGVRWDVGILAGVTDLDPDVGLTVGITKRFSLRGK